MYLGARVAASTLNSVGNVPSLSTSLHVAAKNGCLKVTEVRFPLQTQLESVFLGVMLSILLNARHDGMPDIFHA